MSADIQEECRHVSRETTGRSRRCTDCRLVLPATDSAARFLEPGGPVAEGLRHISNRYGGVA